MLLMADTLQEARVMGDRVIEPWQSMGDRAIEQRQ